MSWKKTAALFFSGFLIGIGAVVLKSALLLGILDIVLGIILIPLTLFEKYIK